MKTQGNRGPALGSPRSKPRRPGLGMGKEGQGSGWGWGCSWELQGEGLGSRTLASWGRWGLWAHAPDLGLWV